MSEKSKILVAESGAIVALDIETLLEEWGYPSFETAKSDDQAMRMVVSSQPDLVIIDTDLQGHVAGDEVAQHISTDYHVPVILLLDRLTQDWENRLCRLKSFYCVEKPFDCGKLRHVVDEALVLCRN